ncbi:outer membrane lipoprotein carrier protein LolA [Vitiosangium sp. GDMCC 1.1324]|uniref:outer membrane lipoprotein carrier protein LolA n=1 Tax=Vitiosangium sp. (strain GDMCC 1.1324) TaxID=2138576 RepID=UPI00130E4D78|nr:outer membrane lipoprotein carrier protein LolA [Vitiosangium sp. GDMCC 1.1324]
MKASLARTQKLSARFKQTRHWTALQDALVSEGSIQYQKGGKLVWHTEPPAENELILEGKTVTIRYPGLGTTQTLDTSADPGMAKVFECITAVLQADLERLQPLFELSIERKAPLGLALKPRTKELSQVIQGIRLSFDEKLRLTHIVLEESSGDRTEIDFHGHVMEESK